MSAYEYTVEHLRGVFTSRGPEELASVRGKWLDSWLVAHDREVAAKAWDEGQATERAFYLRSGGKNRERNPYKEGK